MLVYLSFERYKKTTDLSAETLERLHERVEREVQSAAAAVRLLRAEGALRAHDLGHGDWRVTIDIDPGPPVLLDQIDVQVHGPGETDPLFTRITGNLPLTRGDRLNHATYETLKADLQRTAATYGYLDAKLTTQRAHRRSAEPQSRASPSRCRPATAISLRHHDASNRGGQRCARPALPALSTGRAVRPDRNPADSVRAG